MSSQPHARGGRGGGGGRGEYRGRGGGRGGHAEGRGGGAQAGGERERPKKENILDLGKYMDKRITVKFTGGREGEFLFPGFREIRRHGASFG
jgi:U6 snRNA-associated Sm-like protein LSm7